MTDALIEKVARAIFDADNEWRVMQDGVAGEVMDERVFKVTIVEWKMFARAALAAIEESGTHVVVPVELTAQMEDSVGTFAELTASETWAGFLAARPKVTP